MAGILKRIGKALKTAAENTAMATKAVEDSTLTSAGNGHSISMSVNQQVTDSRVSRDLLKGELTEQVQELRYRTYRVDRESQELEYFGPNLVKKRENYKRDNKNIKYENADGLDVICIQSNDKVVEDVRSALEYVDTGKSKPNEYLIKVYRDFMPTYRIESYLTRLVVKKSKSQKETAILDFYVDAYPRPYDKSQVGFLSALKKVRDTGARDYMLDLGKVGFTTFQAYGQEDMHLYEFDKLVFMNKIIEYDGHYIIRFKAHILVNGRDLMDDFYNKEMADKYRSKAPKEGDGGTFDFKKNVSLGHKEYTCEMCGKKIIYDEGAILYGSPERSRYIVDDDGNETEGKDKGNLEYYDAQIAYVTYGKWLCKDCLEKYRDSMKYGQHLD